MKPTMRLILAIGDLVALFAFVLVGQADHSTVSSTNPLLGALPNVISLGVPWFILAWLLGAFPRGVRHAAAAAGPFSPGLGDRRTDRAGDPHALAGPRRDPHPLLDRDPGGRRAVLAWLAADLLADLSAPATRKAAGADACGLRINL